MSNIYNKHTGKKILKLVGFEQGSDKISIKFVDGEQMELYHLQECCERVEVEQVDGNIERHIGATFIYLDEKNIVSKEGDYGSSTATFYTLKTSKGFLDFRWIGESNGYYSETVTVKE